MRTPSRSTAERAHARATSCSPSAARRRCPTCPGREHVVDLRRHVRPRPVPEAAGRRRRRLHRLRVRVDLQRPGRRGDAGAPRDSVLQRLRRRHRRLRRAARCARPASSSGCSARRRRSQDHVGRRRCAVDTDGAAGEPLVADTVLYATGRAPNIDGLGLEAVGVDARRAAARSRSTRASAPRSTRSTRSATSPTHKQLTPVALAEAMALVDDLFGPAPGKPRAAMSYEFIPTAVFTHPNVGTVGYTEREARAAFGEVTRLPRRLHGRCATRCRAATSARWSSCWSTRRATGWSACTWSAPRPAR